MLTTSVLGGVMEGLVFKNYALFGPDHKVLMAKYVSEKFRETHKEKGNGPKGKEVAALIGGQFRNEARWLKAVSHLRDEGLIEDSPRDIGKLLREVHEDILREETDYIKDKLFAHYWKPISRIAASGFAEWYKEKLAMRQFSDVPERVSMSDDPDGTVDD